MRRTTLADLENLITRINIVTDSPLEYSVDNKRGGYDIQIGHYHLSGAYGGWQLQRTMNKGGGVNTPLGGGFDSKREMYGKLNAFLSGLGV